DAVTAVMASSYSVMLPLAVAVLSSDGLAVWAVTLVVGATSVGVNVKLVVPVEPSALVTVMVTLCRPSVSGADSDQLQPLFVNELMVPSDAVTAVMASSYSVIVPEAVAVVFSAGLAVCAVTLV